MSIIDSLLDLMFPPVCHVCDCRLSPHERFVCTNCLAELPRTGFHRHKMNPMEERLAGHFPFERATGHFFYTRESPFASLIHDMKYRHFPDIGNTLGAVAGQELFPTGFFHGIDLIIPVPMHFFKEAKRGYNQVHHIGAGLSQATGIPVNRSLKATRGHRTQTALSGQERLANTAGLFKVAHPEEIEGKNVLIVDDICTTGATLSAAGDAIWEANPANLSLFSLGVTF